MTPFKVICMLIVGTWRYYSRWQYYGLWRYYGSWRVMVVISYALLVLSLSNLVKKIAFELCKWFCKVVSKQGICEWFWMWGVNEVWGLTHINSTCYLHSFKWNINHCEFFLLLSRNSFFGLNVLLETEYLRNKELLGTVCFCTTAKWDDREGTRCPSVVLQRLSVTKLHFKTT